MFLGISLTKNVPLVFLIHVEYLNILSLQMNEILQFISLQMNEILKVELQLISPQCALDVSIIVGNPEVHPIISSVLKHVTLQVLDFISVSQIKKQPHMAHCYFRVCFHHNKQYKKAYIVNNIAVISSDSYQTKTWWRAEIAE